MGSAPVTRVAVLGDGVTGTAVKQFLQQSKLYSESPLLDADLVVTSPGIPPREWPHTSLEILSDIEFVIRILRRENRLPPIIGVTGTNGKTTIASGIAHGLSVNAYGNIGQPLISDINQLNPEQPIVLELSSYQLVSSPTLHCNTAVIVNIDNDHIDWHETHQNYINAKLSITKPDQTLLLPKKWINQLPAYESVFIQPIESLNDVRWDGFLGHHNQQNAAIISAVLDQYGMSKSNQETRMASFLLPPFRCQKIHSSNNRVIINDSKATNMAATQAAVMSFAGPKLLILAGQPKEKYDDLFLQRIFADCDTVYAAGELAKNKDWFPVEWQSRIGFFDTLELATQSALDQCQTGTILFSPSAASFDEFKNYIDRGEAFNQYVNKNI